MKGITSTLYPYKDTTNQTMNEKRVSKTKEDNNSLVLNLNGKDLGNGRKEENQNEDSDVLSISAAGMQKLQEDYLNHLQEEAEKQSYQEQIRNSKESADAFKDQAKLMEIARRIANGDKVPQKDERKLMEYNAQLYQAAKAAAVLNANKKHKSCTSVYDEEEDTEQQQKNEEQEKINESSGQDNYDTVFNNPVSIDIS